MVYQLGEVLKRVRQSKRYTQKYVAGNEMSRATYAKIEACDMQPTVGKFMHILKQLDITYEELTYIQNSFSLNGKDQILHDFFQLSFSTEYEKIHSLREKCDHYLINNSDNVVQDIAYVCNALLSIHTDHTFEYAFPYAKKVWDRLSKLDNWYSLELKLINNIFFFFPLDTAISIAKRALHEIDRFSYIIKNVDLKSAYLLNMSILFMKNKQYEEAFNYVEQSIKECKAIKQYDRLALVYGRKGIALINMNKLDEGLEFIRKGLSICKVLELDFMTEAIIQEVNELTNITFSTTDI
ncbi:Rgg/GadR/MutR family transcriptional regulator [Sporolactobacillus kofuensis]|uniref:Rgg/GadR/MutR family transcriptional regulator n=1 Tax=Sporolactobacillus kofuensis TaxID=269672 RepID=A0ABW1WFB4_9BACL|nr:Rgg/GadR/MutR family transcriptional regulator [Sporolactobacillus kofuensis]MCO7176552.1 Rgg/GadR/MutR family transcriptional regulator [Sporolactobacillus kofuensis]